MRSQAPFDTPSSYKLALTFSRWLAVKSRFLPEDEHVPLDLLVISLLLGEKVYFSLNAKGLGITSTNAKPGLSILAPGLWGDKCIFGSTFAAVPLPLGNVGLASMSICWEWRKANRSISGGPIAWQVILKTRYFSFHSDMSLTWRDSQSVVTFRLPWAIFYNNCDLMIFRYVIWSSRNWQISLEKFIKTELFAPHSPLFENIRQCRYVVCLNELIEIVSFCETW